MRIGEDSGIARAVRRSPLHAIRARRTDAVSRRARGGDRRVRACLLAGLATLLACTRDPAPELVIRNATVIDGTGRAPQPGRDVCIAAGTIVSLGSDCVAGRNATIIDATGLYLLPGFVDMHMHLLEHGRDATGALPARIDWPLVRRSLDLLIEHGVTTVRDPGSETEAAVTLRQMLARGEVRGPRVFTAGRMLNASSFSPEPFVIVRTADEVRGEIRWQKAAGVDVIKVYSGLTPALVSAAIDEAHALGLPVVGHLQRTTWTEAARMGIDQLTHGAPWTPDLLDEESRSGYVQNLFGRAYWLDRLDLASASMDTLIGELVRRGVTIDPTLIASHTKFFGDDTRWTDNVDNALVPPELVAGWKAGSFTKDWTPEQYRSAQHAWPKMLALTRLFHDRGVRLTVGTDAPTAWIVPGASLHDEMALLRDAGIPPLAILTMATSEGARALGRAEEFGTIEPDRRADLVLLTQDPLARIEHTRSIAAVFQGGRIACASPALRGVPAGAVGACRSLTSAR